MGAFIDLTGRRFGRLLVVRRDSNSGRNVRWLCLCDCGGGKPVARCSLQSGLTRSCGCLERENRLLHATTHGLSKLPEYRIWKGMKDRCHNENSAGYRNYGAKGVSVCGAWRLSFLAFIESVGPRPGPQYSIDRIDPTGNYEPGNCRWATAEVQACNRRYRRSPLGVKGVYLHKSANRFYAVGFARNEHIGSSPDFFEACCFRKSYEAKLGASQHLATAVADFS